MRAPKMKPNAPREERDFPLMVYPGGDVDKPGQVVGSPEEIPEGYKPAKAAKLASGATKAPASSEKPNKGKAKALGMNKRQLVAELTAAEIEFDPKSNADDLAAIYESALEDEDEDEDEDESGDDEDESDAG